MQGTQERRVWSLGQEDPLEKEMATHSSILTWEIQWTEEPSGLYIAQGVAKSWTRLSACACACMRTHAHQAWWCAEARKENIQEGIQPLYVEERLWVLESDRRRLDSKTSWLMWPWSAYLTLESPCQRGTISVLWRYDEGHREYVWSRHRGSASKWFLWWRLEGYCPCPPRDIVWRKAICENIQRDHTSDGNIKSEGPVVSTVFHLIPKQHKNVTLACHLASRTQFLTC